ncbi:MAG: hypothetical protein BWY32_02300 [bacterium ADurb.Bin243]|nr:MAG: hypothetical protein BWY32_02300 [bacterium ADurb.Bin243]
MGPENETAPPWEDLAEISTSGINCTVLDASIPDFTGAGGSAFPIVTTAPAGRAFAGTTTPHDISVERPPPFTFITVSAAVCDMTLSARTEYVICVPPPDIDNFKSALTDTPFSV